MTEAIDFTQCERLPGHAYNGCLLPQADDDIMRRVIEDKAERDARIYTFPASALKKNGKKSAMLTSLPPIARGFSPPRFRESCRVSTSTQYAPSSTIRLSLPIYNADSTRRILNRDTRRCLETA